MKDVLLWAFFVGFVFACAVETSSKLTPAEIRMRQNEEKRCGS